jgi:dTDP-4-dehydrorhamnose reductase
LTINRAVTGRRPLIVNCAAWTDVDGAEADPDAANRANGTGVGELAERCARVGATLVHYSSDYVFAGDADRPYRICDPAAGAPNAYGRTKWLGETLVQASGCRFLLIRASWLYAPWGKNFVRTIAARARAGHPLRVVDDQRGRPTSCQHLAASTLALVERGATQTYHVTDGGECTWFEFAQEIARLVNPACIVEPCSSAEFPRPAKRPPYSVLDLAYTEALLGPMPDWRANLADVIRRLE